MWSADFRRSRNCYPSTRFCYTITRGNDYIRATAVRPGYFRLPDICAATMEIISVAMVPRPRVKSLTFDVGGVNLPKKCTVGSTRANIFPPFSPPSPSPSVVAVSVFNHTGM
jgi:hypothetical protein